RAESTLEAIVAVELGGQDTAQSGRPRNACFQQTRTSSGFARLARQLREAGVRNTQAPTTEGLTAGLGSPRGATADQARQPGL
ncbi:MAG: hypothetical protein V3T64_13530, partial [Myxococcota bacterium]